MIGSYCRVEKTDKMRYPSRYLPPLDRDTQFYELIERELRPGMTILDVGSGHRPTVPRDKRPRGCVYVGMDVSEAELRRAPTHAYDETTVSDLRIDDPALHDRFDLIVSLQVFEHVRPLDPAIENLRLYLRPGGVMITLLTGKWTYFALANRILPRRLKLWMLERWHDSKPEDVFPAYYHRCYASALQRLFASWTRSDIRPFYMGVGYVAKFPAVARTYLRFEKVDGGLQRR